MERAKLTGRVVTPDDAEYEQARINNNLSIPKYPSKIVFCQNTKDVLNALRWVRENNIPFRIRSGRHSYENYSLVNGGLVIDVSDMSKIEINYKEMTARIEAGANLGKVNNKLLKYGMAIPAGTEGSVCLVGLTLGGGIGMLSRPFGLTCDNLIEMEMVRASGHKGSELMKANKEHNSDLFWACCGGGGGNFGIVTSLTFKLHAISNVSIFSVSWAWSDFENAFQAWQEWAPYTDEHLTSQIELKSKEANEIIAQGVFIGPSTRLKELIRPLTTTGSPKVWIKEVPYIKAVRFFDVPAGNLPALRKRSGSFIEETLPAKAISKMKRFLANAPNENASIWHQSLGGAVGRIAPNDSAYFYRNAIIAQEYITTWESMNEERPNIGWIEALRNTLSPFTDGDYVNFPDRFIKDWPITYYGGNLKRLREVKMKYDPFNLFHFPQSIPPFKRWF